ncbi:MAG: glucosamine-6-phosphate deaminase [Firmicutes bacterium]|nr:glucosamine-6-phosphate deaminase [Bacillota bacterium]
MKKIQKEQLNIQVYETRAEMGKAAAEDLACKLRELLATRENLRIIFASAPSQNEFFAHLATIHDIDFSRITAFHLDEYIGLAADAPQGFGNFLKDRLFSKILPGKIHFFNGQAENPEAECERYAALINEAPIDIVCMGIGENAHIAFNDPPVADFNDPKLVKIVELDEICRQQQVNDGCFPTFDDVPTHAVTLTIPAIIGGETIFCMVPGPTKANAVYNSLEKEISTEYPASILRKKQGATLYLDKDSSKMFCKE